MDDNVAKAVSEDTATPREFLEIRHMLRSMTIPEAAQLVAILGADVVGRAQHEVQRGAVAFSIIRTFSEIVWKVEIEGQRHDRPLRDPRG